MDPDPPNVAAGYHVVKLDPRVLGNVIANSIVALSAWLVVGLRLVSRRISGAGWGMDDFLIAMALPQTLAMIGVSATFAAFGNGHQVTEVRANMPLLMRFLVAYVSLFASSTLTIKLSVLCFYLRCFVNPRLRRAIKIVMVWVALWSLGNILQVFLICRPFAANYDPTVHGTCGNQRSSFIAIGCFNAITDVVILCLPIPTIWKLKASARTRLAVTAVFAAGLLTTVVSICRIVAMNSLDFQGNFTRTTVWPDLLSCLEVHVSIITVSLPTLRPALRIFFGGTQKSEESSTPNKKTPKTFGSMTIRRPGRCRLEDTTAMDSIHLEEALYVKDANTRSQFAAGPQQQNTEQLNGSLESDASSNAQELGACNSWQQPDQVIKVHRSYIVAESWRGRGQEAP
ncbi:hypothetical protein CDD82_4076 [Ophiocordyceps australis]|uniref:Rhodopsin domain-containing protein n=1 Tax=Ophiocordyceps australis TaxID=1399860 RepID=A0A2C5YDP5_9HYPO|nr:hypothetical protein CDD82_4076 [Ophiocordyceps australis]